MKICFVGLGSIAKRHLLNLVEILKERETAFEIHALRSGSLQLDEDIAPLISQQFTSDGDCCSDYDIVFVTNPTKCHYETIQKMVPKTKHMFIEKPVFDSTCYDIAALELKPDGVYYVACPLRYTNVLSYVKDHLLGQKIYAARLICSTYLPDWRPQTDYRTCYSAVKVLGGGVSIDLIHEWDYLCHFFGIPDEVLNLNGHYSDLEIDSDDISVYIARYADKLVSVHLDYFGRFKQRQIELYTRDEVMVADLIGNRIRFLNSGKEIDFSESRNDYQTKELLRFLDVVDGKCENPNSVPMAAQVLKIVTGVTEQ